jgi:hypothetical protein
MAKSFHLARPAFALIGKGLAKATMASINWRRGSTEAPALSLKDFRTSSGEMSAPQHSNTTA